MRIGINCGHTVAGQPGSGATGFLSESAETRAVGYALMEKLRSLGYTVIDCTNDYADSTSENLAEIVALANGENLDRFYSIHFNAGGGAGTEVFTYGGKDVLDAGRILEKMENLGFLSRGIKDGARLYVVRRTNAPSALIEVCFVDNQKDADRYQRLGAEAIADALCEGITGKVPEKKEELTVAQYEELKAEIRDLTETVKLLVVEVANLKNPVIYNYIDKNMPDWAKASVQKAVDKGIVLGDESGLRLTDNDLRHIVWNDRAGLYD